MLCGGVVAACVVAVVVASTAVTGSSLGHPELSTTSPASFLSSLEYHNSTNRTTEIASVHKEKYNHSDAAEEKGTRHNVAGLFSQPNGDLNLTPAQIASLRKLLLSPELALFNATANTSGSSRSMGEEVRWQCFLGWLQAHSYRAKKDPRTCSKDEREHRAIIKEDSEKECMPLLLLVVPALCNGTKGCVNLTETSIEELLHRYVVYERKRKREAEADDAVIYIVVVLAFYSFGIVFMIANFVRQEQRELEETMMYKQYVKLARDRWLTTRGNMANKLALQALNTFNAIPQTTDVNKVTFV